MNGKQAFVTVLIVILLLYLGLYGLIHNQNNDNKLHHYVLFVLNIIPASSILFGLLVRIMMRKSVTVKKYIFSSFFCTILIVGISMAYIFSYGQTQMIDVTGIVIYCLIINFVLLLCNSAITIMGLN